MFGCKKKAMVSLKFAYNMKRKYPVPTYLSDRIFLSKIQEAGGTFLACLINNTSFLVLQKIYTHSYQGFIWYVKQSILSDYSYDCTIQDCYVCAQ